MLSLYSYILIISIFVFTTFSWPYSVEVYAYRQNTLYNGTVGHEKSNALGVSFVVGVTAGHGNFTTRRALLQFDFTDAMNEIYSVSGNITDSILHLNVRKSAPNPIVLGLFYLTRDWGMGTSNASAIPGIGVDATPGDATWEHAFYPNVSWSDPGGDYAGEAVSIANVTSFGTYTWGVVAAIKNWGNSPVNNYGWVIKSQNETDPSTAKEFYGVYSDLPQLKPKIVIYYDGPVPIWLWIVVGIAGFLLLSALFYPSIKNCTNTRGHTYKTIRDLDAIVKDLSHYPDITKLFNDPSIRVIPFDDINLNFIIGTGGFGSVYRADLKNTGQVVAAKKLNLAGSIKTDDPESLDMLASFAAEIKIMASIEHPNLLPLIGISLDVQTEDILLLTPFVENGSLGSVLFKYKKKFPYQEKVRIMSEIAYGMHYLHSIRPRVIHRDLKSDNVLLTVNYTVKICDFGLSKMVQKYSKTMTTSGTPHYLAPEAVEKGKFSEKSDVFSYGIILWEIYAERRPFEDLNAFQIMYAVVTEKRRPEIPISCPSEYTSLINDCLAHEPSERPNFKKIIEELKVM
eukprot:TRINITY_DN383_c1_g1_i1.p1 TRINITY_DN383_c1_g1~~TRINITY_DN383_c1_g1_i1.p1  ORF type:complete len:569 (-),score=52.98 TRINITY_DN383_c1_g1_i1:53-1759(-)